jgi:hypothetical protein
MITAGGLVLAAVLVCFVCFFRIRVSAFREEGEKRKRRKKKKKYSSQCG